MTVHTGDTIHRLHWGEQHRAGDLHRKHKSYTQKEAQPSSTAQGGCEVVLHKSHKGGA